jgi:hypothetical protein
MTQSPEHYRSNSRGFSNPQKRIPIAGLDGRRREDRPMSACGFPPDEAKEERRRARLNELRRTFVRLVGNEPEGQLLFEIVHGMVSLREVARSTIRDDSVIIRRFPKYLAELKTAAEADPTVWAVISQFLGDSSIR